jgi:asparagine synthase (glutamine-hydrolysing)
LELRVPFLDHKLVEFAAQLPPETKLHGGTGKVLLRSIMKNVLPSSILHRPKKGFPVPTMSWLRGPLKQFTRETLLASGSACHHYFDPQVLREIVDRHEAGADRQQEIWTLLVFEQWHRAFGQARQAVPAHRLDLAGLTAM